MPKDQHGRSSGDGNNETKTGHDWDDDTFKTFSVTHWNVHDNLKNLAKLMENFAIEKANAEFSDEFWPQNLLVDPPTTSSSASKSQVNLFDEKIEPKSSCTSSDIYSPLSRNLQRARNLNACHRCGLSGHFARSCRCPRYNNESNQSQPTPEEGNPIFNSYGYAGGTHRNTRVEQCYVCQYHGHDAASCPRRVVLGYTDLIDEQITTNQEPQEYNSKPGQGLDAFEHTDKVDCDNVEEKVLEYGTAYHNQSVITKFSRARALAEKKVKDETETNVDAKNAEPYNQACLNSHATIDDSLDLINFEGKEASKEDKETIQVTLRRKRKGRKGKPAMFDLTPHLFF